MRIMLKHVRISFPHLFIPKAFNDADAAPAYSASFLLAADDPQVDTVNEAIDRVAIEQWGEKGKAILGKLRAADKVCIHNGDQKADTEGYAGNYYVTARRPGSGPAPTVLGRNKEVLTQADGRPYGGCYVNASLEIYAQNNAWGQRVNATLRGVQFVADGEAFSGGPPASPEEFEDEEADEAELA